MSSIGSFLTRTRYTRCRLSKRRCKYGRRTGRVPQRNSLIHLEPHMEWNPPHHTLDSHKKQYGTAGSPRMTPAPSMRNFARRRPLWKWRPARPPRCDAHPREANSCLLCRPKLVHQLVANLTHYKVPNPGRSARIHCRAGLSRLVRRAAASPARWRPWSWRSSHKHG